MKDKNRYEKKFKRFYREDYKHIYKRIIRRKFKNTNKYFGNGGYYKKIKPFNLFDYC